MRSAKTVLFWISIFALLVLTNGVSFSATTCSYYASPTGTGNGTSSSSPFQIYKFWSVAGPGKTLCLLDGVYTGAGSMIAPPAGLKGTSTNPITIIAANDGQVLIDGQGVRVPVNLVSDNDWFIIEGINAKDTGGRADILIDGGSDNNIVRRVVAWNCPVSGNCEIFGMHGGNNNLFEDTAGFGTGRKIFTNTQSGNSNFRLRRAWGAWTQTTNTVNNPKMTFSLAYNSYNAIYENVIGTWREENAASNPSGNRYGILAMDGIQPGNATADHCANSKYFGSIGYVRGIDNMKDNLFGVLQSGSSLTCITFEQSVAYVEPSTHSGLKSASLNNLSSSNGGPSSNAQKYVTRNTWAGGTKPDSVGSEWKISGSEVASTVGSASNIWNGSSSSGARVCKRYLNGSLTNEPLWPWPMDQRINAALKASGRNPADYFRGTGNTVTSEMETIFGTIPSECKSTSNTASTTGTAPSAPSTLVATP